MERIRSIPLLRLVFAILTGLAAGGFFIAVTLLVIRAVGLIAGDGK